MDEYKVGALAIVCSLIALIFLFSGCFHIAHENGDKDKAIRKAKIELCSKFPSNDQKIVCLGIANGGGY